MNLSRVLFAYLTRVSITGTSTRTPTTVASVAPELSPKRTIATATDNSKKLLAPIREAGAAISCGNRHFSAHLYAKKKIRNVCIISGMAINRMLNGFLSIVSP